MTTRKKSGSGPKGQLKIEVDHIYESFFKGEDLSKNNPIFWDNFFMLKPNGCLFEEEMQKLSNEQLMELKDNINMLFSQCIEMLSNEQNTRVVHAMQNLCMLVNCIYKKTCKESGFDVINILMGFDVADIKMQELLNRCNKFLTEDVVPDLKRLSLTLLLVFATGCENVSQNALLEYIMVNSLFESLMQTLCDAGLRQQHGHNVVLLLTLLVNYRKHEAANPYIVKLSILDNELALNGYGQVITASLTDFCREYTVHHADTHNSWLSSFTNLVENIFIPEDGNVRTQQIRANNALLLALYEAIHLNRNFITMLAQTQTDTSAPPSPSNTLNSAHPAPDLKNATPSLVDIMTQPSNLLVTFFQYCSIVMQDTKNEPNLKTVKLCFLILGCVAEDQYANSIMHDMNITFKVHLHKMRMRHRHAAVEKTSQPLGATLLDLLVEFMMTHLLKKFPEELYLHCIGVVHRVLCYQKRCRVRLNYHWTELWTALINLLKFLAQSESHLAKKMNVFNLSLQVVNIFNLFITYGDTFLPTPESYDELYYEILRRNEVFEKLSSMVLRYTSSDSEFKDSAQKLNNSLINVNAIIKHFTPKISNTSQNCPTLLRDQILEIVRNNYDSLMLKLDSLDQYERYSEKPKHTAFFTDMVRNVVNDTRFSITKECFSSSAVPRDIL